jgi:hypothetical protein
VVLYIDDLAHNKEEQSNVSRLYFTLQQKQLIQEF